MPKHILDMTQEEWAHTWNVNVTSLFNWAQHPSPYARVCARRSDDQYFVSLWKAGWR